MNRFCIKIVLPIILSLFASNGFCSKNSHDFDSHPLSSIPKSHQTDVNNVDENLQELIENSLQGLISSELHLFWTTGYSGVTDKKIHIGGTKYADIFPKTLDKLLANSPAHLKVYLVLDSITQNSNQQWLDFITDKYKLRLSVLKIADVKTNLLKRFHNHQEIINVIFENATNGNPAIASDIYRLIGMIHGKNSLPESLINQQFTYCDVDTLCHGMNHIDIQKLISALFASPARPQDDTFEESSVEDPFYLGRKSRSNDLIKIRIFDTSAYHNFCEDILDRLNESYTSKNTSIFNYFITLQNYMKKFEQADQAQDRQTIFKSYLSELGLNLVQTGDIIDKTGPGFLGYISKCKILENYPHISSMEWHGTQFLQDPASFNPDIGSIETRSEKSFKSLMRTYCNTVAHAFYVRRYSETHPFYKALVNHLGKAENYPYNSPEFFSYFKDMYKCRDEWYKERDIQQWYESVFEDLGLQSQIVGELRRLDPFYAKLNHFLKDLNIHLTVSPETLKNIPLDD